MKIKTNIFKSMLSIGIALSGLLIFGANTALAEYTQMFTISAYYSPLEGQMKYVTGSYDGDIRLNGSGVNSADGTPVYPGMIAAPKTYAFGTKMSIPGIGTVAVHDRGGAIVHAGERGENYDRLDVWMGYGDSGLTRALNWGKRNVEVTVYGIDPSVKENVYLDGFSEAEKIIRTIIPVPQIFTSDLYYGITSDDVGELQAALSELGYYGGDLDKFYDNELIEAVIAFQLEKGIISKDTEFGAGYFGPQTRAKLDAIIDNRRKNNVPQKPLGKDDEGDEVKKLQEALEKLGYEIELTGVFDQQTIEAVFEFQKDQEILNSETDLGAGYFGPKTLSALAKRIEEAGPSIIDGIHGAAVANAKTVVQAKFVAFEDQMEIGATGDDVKRLQGILRNMNLFKTDATGYYGQVTENAVFKFQQRMGIINTRNDFGAGVLGPQTREKLNEILAKQANLKVMKAERAGN